MKRVRVESQAAAGWKFIYTHAHLVFRSGSCRQAEKFVCIEHFRHSLRADVS